MEDFRKELINKIEISELEHRVFSEWLFNYDFNKDSII